MMYSIALSRALRAAAQKVQAKKGKHAELPPSDPMAAIQARMAAAPITPRR